MFRQAFALAVFLAPAAALLGQKLDVKPGLWENRTVDDDGTETVSHTCMTPDRFQEELSKFRNRPGCKTNTANMTSKQIVLDESCEGHSVNMKLHSQLDALDSEHVKAVITTKMMIAGKERNTTMKGDAHFLNASCGNVKPGDPEIIK